MSTMSMMNDEVLMPSSFHTDKLHEPSGTATVAAPYTVRLAKLKFNPSGRVGTMV